MRGALAVRRNPMRRPVSVPCALRRSPAPFRGGDHLSSHSTNTALRRTAVTGNEHARMRYGPFASDPSSARLLISPPAQFTSTLPWPTSERARTRKDGVFHSGAFHASSDIESQAAAIMSARAVFPEPRAPMMATNPGLSGTAGVVIHGDSRTRTSEITCERSCRRGGSDTNMRTAAGVDARLAEGIELQPTFDPGKAVSERRRYVFQLVCVTSVQAGLQPTVSGCGWHLRQGLYGPTRTPVALNFRRRSRVRTSHLPPNSLIRGFPHPRRPIGSPARHRDQDILPGPSALGEHFAQVVEVDFELARAVDQRSALVSDRRISLPGPTARGRPAQSETIRRMFMQARQQALQLV